MNKEQLIEQIMAMLYESLNDKTLTHKKLRELHSEIKEHYFESLEENKEGVK